MAEVENHELTHAYIYTHKKLDFKCPYIDEGLAEYGGKITTRPPGALIENWEVSRFRYYNFLDYVISQNPVAIQELASDWILGNRPTDYWCRITAPYRPR
ncbi:MAG: hypothetical protein IPL99_08520 [Candidatus Competibacteraceae bacterium]|nr:hypothetical protein [Candidatus Competibacteraceae bacterium]